MKTTLTSERVKRFVAPLEVEPATTQARLLKALADPTRLRMVSLLSRYEGEVNVSELTESLPLEQATISHHLRILRKAGLIDCRKKGLWSYYYVRVERIEEVRAALANPLLIGQ